MSDNAGTARVAPHVRRHGVESRRSQVRRGRRAHRGAAGRRGTEVTAYGHRAAVLSGPVNGLDTGTDYYLPL